MDDYLLLGALCACRSGAQLYIGASDPHVREEEARSSKEGQNTRKEEGRVISAMKMNFSEVVCVMPC